MGIVKRGQRMFWLIAVCAALLAAAACGGDGNGDETPFEENPTEIQGVSTPSAFPMEVVRSDGQKLTLAAPAKRIVSLSPGATEIIFALGGEASLAGVDRLANYPAAAASFEPKVDAFQPNVEAIAALTPDLVIAADDGSGIVGNLDRLNIPVLYLDIDTEVRSIDDVFGQIGLLGRITGTEEAADKLLVDLNARVKAIEEKLVGLPTTRGPAIYHELDDTYYSVSDGTFIGSLYRTLHARNIAGDGGGVPYPQLTQEAIIAASPDIIVLADEDFGVTIESVKARPGWSAIKAVQEDRIYGINADIISRPGPRIVDALEQLAKAFYPNAFQ